MKFVDSVVERSLFRRYKRPKAHGTTSRRTWLRVAAGGSGSTGAGRSSAVSAKAHLDRFYRILVLSSIVLCDVAGVIVAIGMVASGPDLVGRVVIATVAVIAGSEAVGLYQVGCLPVLRRTIWVTVACYAGLMLVVVGAAACLAGSALAVRVAGAVACGSVVGLAGRIVWWLVIQTSPRRFAERSVIIGLRVALDQAGWSGVTEFTDVIVLSEADLEPHESAPISDGRFPILARLGRADRITIVKAGLSDTQLRRLLLELDALSSPITVLSDLSGGPETLLALGDAWLIRSAAMRSRTVVIKRMFDICVSLAALVVFSPLFLAVAVAIRLETPGTVLFRQLRHGRDGRPFTVLKFRTMRSDGASADGSIQAVRGDPRVTRLGAFLRKTSIDELPQLLNVLTGSMSLVGPRPHPLALDHRFVPLIERYSARQRVVPGMTGWAQVNGLRGETKNVEQMRRRVELDLEYIRDHSIAFDVLILFRTATSLLTHRHTAY